MAYSDSKHTSAYELGKQFAKQGLKYNPFARVLACGSASPQWHAFNTGYKEHSDALADAARLSMDWLDEWEKRSPT